MNLRNEYLVLHQISWIAIVRCWTEEPSFRLLNLETVTGVLKRSDRSSGEIRQFEEEVGDVSDRKSVHERDREGQKSRLQHLSGLSVAAVSECYW
jgi:hypothetical protein